MDQRENLVVFNILPEISDGWNKMNRGIYWTGVGGEEKLPVRSSLSILLVTAEGNLGASGASVGVYDFQE